MSGELPRVQSKTLFSVRHEKKEIETEAQKVANRIASLRQEHEKLIKKINQTDQKAYEIYQHRVELFIKKQEKLNQKKSLPPPFSLQVSRQQYETLSNIVSNMYSQRYAEVKKFKGELKTYMDGHDTQSKQELAQNKYLVNSMKFEQNQRYQAIEEKWYDKVQKVREEVSIERDRVEIEKQQYQEALEHIRQEKQIRMQIRQEALKLKREVEQKKKLAQTEKLEVVHKLFEDRVKAEGSIHNKTTKE